MWGNVWGKMHPPCLLILPFSPPLLHPLSLSPHRRNFCHSPTWAILRTWLSVLHSLAYLQSCMQYIATPTPSLLSAQQKEQNDFIPIFLRWASFMKKASDDFCATPCSSFAPNNRQTEQGEEWGGKDQVMPVDQCVEAGSCFFGALTYGGRTKLLWTFYIRKPVRLKVILSMVIGHP